MMRQQHSSRLRLRLDLRRRAAYLAVLTAAGLAITAGAHEVRQGTPAPITDMQEVAENLYMLANADPADGDAWTGGNIGVWVTETGVVLVDTKLPGYGQAILEQVRSVTDKPVTTIINTHTHFDHSGSNTEFPETVTIVTHEGTAAQMARDDCQPVTNCEAFQGDNARFLPDLTYSERMSLFSGRDQVDLYHFGRGHTNGDTLIVFPAVRVMHSGDLFPWRRLPFVDADSSGGSAVDYGETLNKAVAGIPDVDRIITGHIDNPVAWAEFEAFAGFYNHLAGVARAGMEAGQSVDDAAAGYAVPDEYGEFSADPDTVRSIMQLIYDGR